MPKKKKGKKKSRGPSAEDRAEVKAGGGSARDRAEVRGLVKKARRVTKK